jgi:hypothetical protein
VPDLPVPTVDAEQARTVVERILAQPEYAGVEPTLWQRVVASVERAIGELWLLLAGTGGGTVLGYAVLALVGVALLVLLWRLTRSLRREAVVEHPLAEDIGRSPDDWLAEAEAHEAAGRWQDAVRCHYRAAIAGLAARGRVEEVPGRTAGEYLAAVRRDLPEAAPAFARATAAFEEAWYGAGAVGPEDVAAMREAAAGVRAVPAGQGAGR